jgi:hypothetical protein
LEDLLAAVATPDRERAICELLRPVLSELPLIAPDPKAALGALADEAAALPVPVLLAARVALLADRAANVKPADIRRAMKAAMGASTAAKSAPAKAANGNAAPTLRITKAEPSFTAWLAAVPERERRTIEAAGELSASARWPKPGARMYAPVTIELGAAA